MLTRRHFLTAAGALAVGGGAAWALVDHLGADADVTARPPGSTTPTTSGTTIPRPTATTLAPTSTTAAAPPPARVLVVVQLGGGNDGLNTLVPVDGRYHDARPTLGLADDTLLPFPGTTAYGLHPALKPLAPLLAAGRVAAIEGVGYQHPDRSHFAALDAWWTATPGQASTTGWLGRYLDLTAGRGTRRRCGRWPSGAAARRWPPSAAGPTAVYAPAAFRLAVPRGVDDDALLAAWRASAVARGSGGRRRGRVRPPRASVRPPPDDPDAGAGAEGEVVGDISDGLAVAAKLIAAGGDTQLVVPLHQRLRHPRQPGQHPDPPAGRPRQRHRHASTTRWPRRAPTSGCCW